MTKHLRRIVSVVAAVAIAMLMAVPFGTAPTAPEKAEAAGTGTITITPPSNTDSSVTNTYKIYKVFDASGNGTSITYSLPSGKTLTGDIANYFEVKDGTISAKDVATGNDGKLTAAAIAAIATFVGGDQPVKTVTSTGTDNAEARDLDDGYYYITTSTGSLVTITSANHSATVNDKNTVPSIEKTITAVQDNAGSITTDGKAAIAQAGKTITYTVKVTFGKGSKNVVFHDTLDTTKLELVSNSGSVTYSRNGTSLSSSDYTFTVKTTPDAGDTITIQLNGVFQEGDVATITYQATVTSADLSSQPAKNKAHLTYGDGGETPDKETEVYNAKVTVTKKDGSGNALAGAGFVLKNSSGQYYKIENGVVSWVTEESDATEHVSASGTGVVPAFTGLPDGTYTLVEKTVPTGYEKAGDRTITINGASSSSITSGKAANGPLTTSNLEKSLDVTNTAGSELPSTGGPGTAWMYAIGGVLVAAAAIGLIARRKMRQH